ncbi:MAG: hypothetical protein IPN90_13905 [Elusimicrobia bacterium]|nr:hypothetical protein [Elusimicrobiota bacterium]
MRGQSFRRVGVLADDFSGAGDVALAFGSVGLATEIWTPAGGAHPSVPGPEVRVWILDTQSRGLLPEDAARAVKRGLAVLAYWKPDFIFKKIDSTLRGPVGAELAAFIDVLRPAGRVPFVPAFPKMGRTTVGGRHFVDGIPLHQTAYGQDPRHPVHSNRVVDFLRRPKGLSVQQQNVAPRECTGSKRKDDFLRGPKGLSVQQQNVATRERVWVPDVANERALGGIARRVLAEGCVAVGSAGFASAIARGMGTRKKVEGLGVSSKKIRNLSVCVVVGSAHPVSGRQMDRLKTLLPWAGVIVVERPVRRGSSARVLSRLVAEAREAERVHRVRRWVVTGGETAFALARLWKESRWCVVGAIEPGVPLCRSVGRRPRFLVLKPGGFGSPDVLIKAVRYFLGKEN